MKKNCRRLGKVLRELSWAGGQEGLSEKVMLGREVKEEWGLGRQREGAWAKTAS